MNAKKELQVSAIENGTVIDHIPAEYLFQVINILGLDNCDNSVTFGNNLESKILGKKAIIKIADKFFEDDEINKISLIAPHAKLNIIKNYQVVEKKIVESPDKVIGIAKCMNPKCITNVEDVTTRFKVIEKTPITLKCHYCEKITDHKHIEII
ncbi:aspartate carbamoyltransferase regulatory subunit [Marinifilum sp. D737]|uniref:aspartate carbamoyltransferase regulatory subunit n=1 Tax=Marinifilum sp. D737 TaxID=2969628 RepID=UPI0022769AC9|nr:aspartate carbamoyltransferase regulatory subunit [Marinifilum sp. D737]MCY1633593.1 aspartate carbamoyltransferase regulatory subunit [Marinifilum sp. D737]